MLRLATAALLLAAPAVAQPQEDGRPGDLSRMLRFVPAPDGVQALFDTQTVFAYARLGPLPGSPGHALSPRAERYRNFKAGVPLVVKWAGWMNQIASAPSWPAAVGFDAEDVEALLIAPATRGLPGDGLHVLAGGSRLHDAARIGAALEGRGFTRDVRDGAPVFSIRRDGEIDLFGGVDGDPFSSTGGAERIGVTREGLLATASTGAMLGALDARGGRAPSLADLNAVRALLAGLPDGEVVQAVALSPRAGIALQNPAGPKPYGEFTLPAAPALPAWSMAAIAELTAPPDAARQRLVLATTDPDGARAALDARLKAAQSGPRPVPVQAFTLQVLPVRFGMVGVLVVDMALSLPKMRGDTPLYRWHYEASNGLPTPFTIYVAGPGQADGKQP